jgi:hypothetical protein
MWDAVIEGLQPQQWHHNIVWDPPYFNFPKFGPHPVETLGDPYRSKTPLPSVPNYWEPDLSCHLIWNMKKPDAEKITRRWKSQTLKKPSTPLHFTEWSGMKVWIHTMYECTCMNSYKCLNCPLHSSSQSGVEPKYEFIQCMNSYKCLP